MAAASSTGIAQPLGQPVGLHAVGQPVGDHLGLGAHGDGDVLGAHAVDPRRGHVVDVGPGPEGLDQPGVLGQVGDDPQLDLVVVRHQETAALRRQEAGPEPPALLAADRDVVQVRLVGAEPAGAGHRLVERGVDAPVRGHLGQQRLPVGRPQLLDFPVAQQGLDDRVLTAQLLERLGVGRVPGLGPLLRGEAELVEQDLPQLRGGVDDELGPGQVLDLLLQPAGLRRQLAGQAVAAGRRRPAPRRPPSWPAPAPAAAPPRRTASTCRGRPGRRSAARPAGPPRPPGGPPPHLRSTPAPLRSSCPGGGASGARSSTPA